MKSIENGARISLICLANHEVRYNCTIIDLHDRSVIASITDRNITSDLAIRTLRKALESQPTIKDGLILHSDQGSQYTSKAFTEFCESVKCDTEHEQSRISVRQCTDGALLQYLEE